MKFNALIPELSVTNLELTKDFYVNMLGFKLEYERVNEKFMFLSFEDSQLMFEEIHPEGWNVAALEYPLGRGINFSIFCENIDSLYHKIKANQIPIYREMKETIYVCVDENIMQKEFLIQDPDGYLLRFTN